MVGGSVVNLSILGILWIESLNKSLALAISLWGWMDAHTILLLWALFNYLEHLYSALKDLSLYM